MNRRISVWEPRRAPLCLVFALIGGLAIGGVGCKGEEEEPSSDDPAEEKAAEPSKVEPRTDEAKTEAAENQPEAAPTDEVPERGLVEVAVPDPAANPAADPAAAPAGARAAAADSAAPPVAAPAGADPPAASRGAGAPGMPEVAPPPHEPGAADVAAGTAAPQRAAANAAADAPASAAATAAATARPGAGAPGQPAAANDPAAAAQALAARAARPGSPAADTVAQAEAPANGLPANGVANNRAAQAVREARKRQSDAEAAASAGRELPSRTQADVAKTKPKSTTRWAGAPRETGPPLRVDHALRKTEIETYTGKKMRRGELGGIHPSPHYNYVMFETKGRGEFGASVQVWAERTIKDTRQRYEQMKATYPNVRDTTNITPYTFFASWGDLYYLAFMDLKRRRVIAVTAHASIVGPERLYQVAKLAHDRLVR